MNASTVRAHTALVDDLSRTPVSNRAHTGVSGVP
jgi:hypothetical protein